MVYNDRPRRTDDFRTNWRPVPIESETITSGFVAVAGAPNVGKSSLVNRLVGETVSVATGTPRTTRYLTRGIVNRPDAQVVLTDTPALHDPDGPLEDHLVQRTLEASGDADLILLVVNPQQDLSDGDRRALDRLEPFDAPMLLVPGAVDRGSREPQELRRHFQDQGPWTEVVPTSAKTGRGTRTLVEEVEARLPEAPRFFPGDQVTDRGLGFRVSERIRAEAMNHTHEEVPHSLAVTADFIGPGEDPDVTVVEATIYVERESQKGILIGKGGRTIKSIGENARSSLSDLLDGKIYLDLSVGVLEAWTERPEKIENLRERKGRIRS